MERATKKEIKALCQLWANPIKPDLAILHTAIQRYITLHKSTFGRPHGVKRVKLIKNLGAWEYLQNILIPINLTTGLKKMFGESVAITPQVNLSHHTLPHYNLKTSRKEARKSVTADYKYPLSRSHNGLQMSQLTMPFKTIDHAQFNWALPLVTMIYPTILTDQKSQFFVFARPTIHVSTSYDRSHRLHRIHLHALGKPAVYLSHKHQWYFNDTILIPRLIGKKGPDEWKPEFAARTNNAEIQQLIIRQVGFEKILKDLELTLISTSQTYKLYAKLCEKSTPRHQGCRNPQSRHKGGFYKCRIRGDLAFTLLKMICPSTGKIYINRVPNDLTTAKEAITWMNWGIKPEDFNKQS